MENEDSCLKCDPIFPRQGKKLLCVLVAINFFIIWFIYRKTDYFSYFNPSSIHASQNLVITPLYNVPIFHIPLLYTKDMTPHYVEVNSDIWCLKEGTDLVESKQRKKCFCHPQWFGLDCGIPASVWKSNFMQEGKNTKIKIMRRDKPRRIILSIVFEDSFELLDINIQYLFSVVDIFLVCEEKNLNKSSLNRFKNGFLTEFQNKIMPIQVNQTVHYNNENERISSLLKEMWVVGWNKLSDFRPDDIFVFSHVFSILSKDVLLFLKLYDGYPEPFYFNLRPLLFRFSNVLSNRNASFSFVPFEPFGCTLQFISGMCDYSVAKLLEKKCMEEKKHRLLFEKQHWLLKEWVIGNKDFPSGWQCNFCCDISCIFDSIRKQKLLRNVSASLPLGHKDLNISVIEKFVKKENYLNNEIGFSRVLKSDRYFCPNVMFEFKKYAYLLD